MRQPDDIEEGEVLWIEPEIHPVPDRPDGFAFRVVHLLGWGDPALRLVWVRGVLLDRRGVPGRHLTLCVPADQRRAVPAQRGLVGPPPGYRRVT
jgi:hypothetical protein